MHLMCENRGSLYLRKMPKEAFHQLHLEALNNSSARHLLPARVLNLLQMLHISCNNLTCRVPEFRNISDSSGLYFLSAEHVPDLPGSSQLEAAQLHFSTLLCDPLCLTAVLVRTLQMEDFTNPYTEHRHSAQINALRFISCC